MMSEESHIGCLYMSSFLVCKLYYITIVLDKYSSSNKKYFPIRFFLHWAQLVVGENDIP